jgi:ABC-type amino acid transport system permease subunit
LSLLRRLTLGVAAVACLATSAAMAVVAAGYALFAACVEQLGPAGASAVVALAAAVLALIFGLILALVARGRKPAPRPVHDVADRLADLVRDRPIAAAAVAAAAGWVMTRNPALAKIASSLISPRRPGRRS